MRIVFKDPRTGYEEVGVTSYTWAWVLLFGPVYFAVKANWRHCVASLILAFATFGLSWLVYPFFAKQVMLAHYRRMGWLAI